MIKTTLSFIATVLLTTLVFAGGDDRDKGPVESLDSFTPLSEKMVVGDQKAKSLTIPEAIESAAGAVYETCEDTFASDSVWIKYTCVVALGLLAL